MASPHGYPQSPFLSEPAVAGEEPGSTGLRMPSIPIYPLRSPFFSAFELDGSAAGSGPGAEEMARFRAELYDHEFDEAINELIDEASALYEARRLEHEHGGTGAAGAERFLRAHFAPLYREVDSLFEAVGAQVRGRDLAELEEGEVETLFERYQPRAMEPSFEFIFGGLKKKLGGIVKKGINLAKKGIAAAAKLGLGPILDKLRALVKPLLDRVLQMAIGKLPQALRPHAEKLRDALLKKVGMAEAAEEDASPDPAEIQREFDEQAATLLFTGDDVQQELLVSRYAASGGAPEEDPVERLNEARARFAMEVSRLREGEDAGPQVEQFIPAILPALKLGVKLAGRKRVVSFLAGLLGKLIQKLVGKEHTPALSQAIVDAGLRLIQLETTPEEEARVAAEAVAGTVEETVRRLAAAPDYVLADEQLLEGFVLEAFEASAAELLPPVLPARVYEARPELRASGLGGAWVFQPLRGRTRRYQKYTRVPETTITPEIARAVRSFGGTPLAAYLQQRFGLPPGRTVRARMHLYRAIPGTTLARIAGLERRDRGGGAQETGYSVADFHPLTPEASGYLLREPGLGAAASAELLAGRERSAPGERFYRLEIVGAPVPRVARRNGRAAPPRSTGVRLALDFPRSQVHASLFLGEREAQRLAAALRDPGQLGTGAARLQSLLRDGLTRILTGESGGRLRVIHDGVPAGGGDAALRRLPQAMQARLAGRLVEWAGQGLSEGLTEQALQLVRATEADADGVTAVVTLDAPPGFSHLRSVLSGGLVDPDADPLAEGRPEARLEFRPGYHRA